jgi:hypothetical protein
VEHLTMNNQLIVAMLTIATSATAHAQAPGATSTDSATGVHRRYYVGAHLGMDARYDDDALIALVPLDGTNGWGNLDGGLELVANDFLALFAHGLVGAGPDVGQLRVGAEVRDRSVRAVHGFFGLDLGYRMTPKDALETEGGALLAPRAGLEFGKRFRFRVSAELPIHYVNGTSNPNVELGLSAGFLWWI